MGRSKISPDKKKKPKTRNEKYPVLYYIGGIPIRASNFITIYIPEMNMVKVATAAAKSNLSIAKLLALSGQPCESCKNTPVEVTVNGTTVAIPRGLMSFNKQNSGETTKNKHKKEAK